MSDDFKRYVLVTYNCYNPYGFENDVEGRFTTIDEAKIRYVEKKVDSDIIYIFDLVKWERVQDLK